MLNSFYYVYRDQNSSSKILHRHVFLVVKKKICLKSGLFLDLTSSIEIGIDDNDICMLSAINRYWTFYSKSQNWHFAHQRLWHKNTWNLPFHKPYYFENGLKYEECSMHNKI